MDASSRSTRQRRERSLTSAVDEEIDRGLRLPVVRSLRCDDSVLLLDFLADRVLCDRDWEMDEQLDADPDLAGAVKGCLGIDADYFVAVPPEPTHKEAERLLAALRSLTRTAA